MRIFLRIHCEQEPTSGSSITLTDQRDPLGLLRVRFDWQISERELETIRQYVLIAQRSLSDVARIIPDPDLMSGNPNFLARCDDSNHHMGGMRMSTSDSAGIVDPNLHLYGTDQHLHLQQRRLSLFRLLQPHAHRVSPGRPPQRSSNLTHHACHNQEYHSAAQRRTRSAVAIVMPCRRLLC